MRSFDAIVVGSGPNGLAAAITLLREGLGVQVIEASARPGGGLRSAELTLPGFLHDVCSAIHPLARASPFFRSLPLEALGVDFIEPPAAVVHPLRGGPAGVLERSLDETARGLGADGEAWRALYGPFANGALLPDLLAPLRFPARPLQLARFGLLALRSASSLARARFRGGTARALFAGCAAHAVVPLEFAGTAAFGLLLALSGHAVGWPCVRGGSGRLADALCAEVRRLGGELVCGQTVSSLAELPPARAVLFDVAPRNLAAIAGDALPARYRAALQRFRHGPGVFKLDWALAAPIPWRDPSALRAATVHLGGPLEEVEASERDAWEGRAPSRPYVLLAQPSLFDDGRAPPGRHTAWAYCHVPAGWRGDAIRVIEERVEEFAPGFRDVVLARAARGTERLERDNPNLVGGDIGGGANDLRQLFARPVARAVPAATPNPRLFLCSSSTPPGGGVHGMCGYHAARAALRRVFGRRLPAGGPAR